MKHYIIVKFKEEVSAERKQDMVPDIEELFHHLYEIDGISDIQIERNCVDRANRYDLMIEITMQDEDVLRIYDQSVWHNRWKDQYGPLIAKKTIFDRGE